MAFVKDYDHLKIEMEDIVSATDNFDSSKVIGGGGFGRVYKGEITLPEGQTTDVAFKKLDRRLGQGNTEFWKEIMMLSRYKHEHLISLLRFCIEGDEMILVYEYATRGSLDRYLSDVSLTWTQRLKICVGAARGLHFLHDPKEKQQRLIHRDIKSGNILLDEKWTAKVSDFGLSKAAPANQPQTYVFSNAVGTPGYCDPVYWETGFLSKESDVYSFGVVLFEVLCGRLCCEYRKGELTNILVPKWRRCYDDKSLEDIIPPGLREQMEPHSLNSFSAIAYRCVKKAREERPTMAEIVKELEFALEQQDLATKDKVDNIHLQEIFDKLEKRSENFEDLAMRVDLATELIRIADLPIPPQIYGSHKQLLRFLYKGFFVDDQEAWISMNVNGEVTKVVSAAKCFFGEKHEMKVAGTKPTTKSKTVRCKFPYYLWNVYNNHFRVEVNTRFLAPQVTYDIYIVFKYCGQGRAPRYTPFEYKLDNETHYSTSCIAYKKQNSEWMMTKLYQFTSHHRQQTFSIQFFPRYQLIHYHEYAFEGIEFRPVQHKTCAKQVKNFKINTHLETNLATKFADLLKLSKDVIQWKTGMELYSLLRKGFLTIEPEEFQRLPPSRHCSQPTLASYHSRFNRLHSQMYDPFLNQKSVPLLWISISKFMKKRLMIPASTFLSKSEWACNSVAESESRFKVVTKSLIRCWFDIHLQETLDILSPQTTYSCHLIYKLSDNYISFKGPMVVGITGGSDDCLFPLSVCLNTRCRPPIIGTKDDRKSFVPLETCKMDGHSKRRKDGWMEIQFAEVTIPTSNTWYRLSVQEENFENTNFFGIVIEGIEFRAL